MFQFLEIPNLRHLRMVQVIGQLGGVSSASRELSTSQPAVSQAVANLEAVIGTPIFDRCKTGTYPTPLGKQYLLRLDRFFGILDNVVSQVMGGPENDHHGAKVDRLMTVTQLRAHIATCDHDRLPEIADSLGMVPSSLIRSARSLEKVFGKPLFDRTAQGPVPNRAGSFLAREFRRAVREIELAHGEILMAAGAEALDMVIGAMPMAGSHEMADATRRFMSAFPTVNVRIITGNYDKLLLDLSNARIDMIFGILRKPDWAADMREELLLRDRYCVVSRPGHPLTSLADVTPADLAGYDWVVPTRGTPRRTQIEAIFDGMKTQPRFNLETPSLAMTRAFVLRSDTLTLMTRSEVSPDLEQGMLASLPCRFFESNLRKGVTTRGDWLPTVAHTAFLDCLREVGAETTHHRVDHREVVGQISQAF